MAPIQAAGKKRSIVKVEVGGRIAAKKARVVPSTKTKKIEFADDNNNNNNIDEDDRDDALKQQFIDLFADPAHSTGISNTALKSHFGDKQYVRLVPIINTLMTESKLNMSRVAAANGSTELFYNLVSDELAEKFAGLDVSARLVYQVIEKAGNMGIWTKDIKKQTNIQVQALNKIFKALETRRLIKPVKSIAAKARKLYMLFDLTPSTELTGGIWYSDLEFDHGFINEMRNFLTHCVRKLNGGKGVTVAEILKKLNQAQISKVSLGPTEVGQLLQTLVYDNIVMATHDEEHNPLDQFNDQNDAEAASTVQYVPSRRVTMPCSEFGWWNDCLQEDFHFRTIHFEDGVSLAPHEPHFHT